MIRNCKICGKEFETNGTPAKCCSKECSAENNRQNGKAKYKEYYEKRKAKKIKKSNMKQIVDLTVEARRHGMTYGQYVAKMYLERGC